MPCDVRIRGVLFDERRSWKDEVGGIRISHLSHIEKALTVALTATRGKRKNFTVQPLAAPTPPRDESGRDWPAELLLAADDIDAVAALGSAAKQAHAAAGDLAAIRAKWTALDHAAKSTPAEQAEDAAGQ